MLFETKGKVTALQYPCASDTIWGVKRLLAIISTVILGLSLVTVSAAPAFAADGFSGDCSNGGVKVSVGINDNDKCVGGNGENPIYAYLRGIIKFATGLIGVLISLALVIAGFQWMTSQGDPGKLKNAKTRIANAVISLMLFILMASILTYLIPGVFS